MPTAIRIDIRLDQEPDALYREAYRRATLEAPDRPITTELYELVVREADADAGRLMEALNGVLADLVAGREVKFGAEKVEPEWSLDIKAA